jgi:hypothetical protein
MRQIIVIIGALVILAILLCPPLLAGEADVTDVKVRLTDDGFDFAVTVRHDDTGWDHYADRWEVLDADRELLAKRVLYHPHVHEQPFTRHLTGVRIPDGIASVTVRAHDSVHEYGGRSMTIDLPR